MRRGGPPTQTSIDVCTGRRSSRSDQAETLRACLCIATLFSYPAGLYPLLRPSWAALKCASDCGLCKFRIFTQPAAEQSADSASIYSSTRRMQRLGYRLGTKNCQPMWSRQTPPLTNGTVRRRRCRGRRGSLNQCWVVRVRSVALRALCSEGTRMNWENYVNETTSLSPHEGRENLRERHGRSPFVPPWPCSASAKKSVVGREGVGRACSSRTLLKATRRHLGPIREDLSPATADRVGPKVPGIGESLAIHGPRQPARLSFA